jgi:hypothetical protein
LDRGLDIDHSSQIDIAECPDGVAVLLVILPEQPLIIDESDRQGITIL